MSRAHTVLRTGAWSVARQTVAIASQLAVVPLFLRHWQPALYGDWLVLWSLSAYVAFADIGLQGFALNRLVQHAAAGRIGLLREELSSVLALELTLVGILVPGFVVGLAVLPPAGWLAGTLASDAGAVAGLLVLRVAITVLLGLAGGLYRVLGRPDLMEAVSCAELAATLVATIGVLLCGGGPLALAGLILAVDAVLFAGVAWDTRRRDARLALGLRHARRDVALRLVGPSLLFFLFTLAQGLTVQGLILVVAAQLGSTAVVTFSTTRVVANLVRQTVAQAVHALWNEFTRLDAEGAIERLYAVYRLTVKVAGLTAGALAAVLLTVGPELYAWWTGSRTVGDVRLLRWLLVDQVLVTPAFIAVVFLAATNSHRAIAVVHVVAGVLVVLTAALLARHAGLSGLGIAVTAVDVTVLAAVAPYLAQQKLGRRLWITHRDLTLPVWAAGGVLALLAAGTKAIVPGVLGQIMAVGTVIALAAPAILWLALLDQSERRFLDARLLALGRRGLSMRGHPA